MEHLPKKKEINTYMIQSFEEEIKRIALELHEGVGQTLYSVYMGIQFLEASTAEGELKNYAHEMAEILEKTIQEIRFLSVELHPPTLTTLGLLPALKSYLNLFTSTYGILVDIKEDGQEIPLLEHHRITLFRVCQEALGNIAKYADSLQVKIQLIWESEGCKISIQDFGIGFDVEQNIHKPGLAAMIERMHIIGGDCHISSTVGVGTTILLVIPYQ